MGPRDTRRVLLDAAAEQFAAHGVRGTRVHAIVKRSKVNERLIYHHFGSKDGLYRAVIADQWTDLAGAWRQTLTRASRRARDMRRVSFRFARQVEAVQDRVARINGVAVANIIVALTRIGGTQQSFLIQREASPRFEP